MPLSPPAGGFRAGDRHLRHARGRFLPLEQDDGHAEGVLFVRVEGGLMGVGIKESD